MMDKIYYLCFRLSLIKFFRYFFILYYKCAAYCVSFFLVRKNYVKHAYLKGSFYKHYFSPVLSDLDFFIIGDKTEAHQKEIEKIFKYLHYVFPMVSDFDFYTDVESKLLFNFSGVKFFPSEKWKVLKGENVEFTYRFNPRKLSIDVIQEIFFQFEWLFKNIKKRSKTTKYTTVCIQRQFLKIKDLVKYIEHYDCNLEIVHTAFVEDEKWHNYTNEEIIKKFNDLVEESEILNQILKIYENEFSNYQLNKVLKEEYYKEELVLVDESFEYTGKYLNLSFKNLKLFYYTGCIDSYLLFQWCEKSTDLVSRQYIEMSYYIKLIESKKCSKHDYNYFLENIEKVLQLQRQIVEGYRTEKIAGLNVFNRNLILVDVKLSKKNDQDYLVNMHKDWKVLGISYDKGGTSIESIVPTLSITREDYLSEISNREHLLLLLAKWCFGARNILVLGNRVRPYKNHFHFIEKFQEIQNEKMIRLIQDKPVSVFLGSWHLWSKVNHFFYGNLCLKNEFFISTYLTSKIDKAFDAKELLAITNFKDGLDFELEEVKISLDDYNDEEEELLLGYLPLFKDFFEVNEIGLIKLKPSKIKDWISINKMINDNLDPYDELKKIDSLSVNELLNINRSGEWSLWGSAKIISYSKDEVKFYSGRECGKVIFKKHLDELSKEYLHIQAEFEGEIDKESIRVGVEEKSIYNSYEISSFRGNDLYNMNFWIKTFKKTNIMLKFEMSLEPNRMYHFRIKELIQKSEDSVKSKFYRKIESFNNEEKILLGDYHEGFYKFVLKKKDDFNALAKIVDDDQKIESKEYSSSSEYLVLFHFVCKSSTTLHLVWSDFSKNSKIEYIDILKLD